MTEEHKEISCRELTFNIFYDFVVFNIPLNIYLETYSSNNKVRPSNDSYVFLSLTEFQFLKSMHVVEVILYCNCVTSEPTTISFLFATASLKSLNNTMYGFLAEPKTFRRKTP